MKRLLLIVFLLISVCAFAEESINNDILFKGVTKQSSDYSCGAAALSTLITGLVENSHISENDIMRKINSSKAEEKGYTLEDLKTVSTKLGYYAEWQKVPTSELPKINIPVMLLIGLNSKFPHFVVLKGVKNNTAFLADSIRGNIRIPYNELIKESINDKFKEWFVMAIEPSVNKPKDSNLYLADNENERINNHATVEQSNIITLATMPKSNQILVDYGFNASFGNKQNNGLKTNSETFSHTLNVRYGITEDLEIGGMVQHSDNTTDIRFANKNKLSSDSSNRQYSLFVNHKFKLDDTGKTNLILGLTGLYAERNVFGTGLNITAYRNTEFAQLIAGGSFNKDFGNNALTDYTYSGFISANKPLGDRYLASVGFAVNDGQYKFNQKFDRSYSVSTSLSYVLSKEFQLSPSFSYAFGTRETFSFGMNIAYVGGW